MNWTDLVVIAILGLSTFIGYRLGLLSSLFRFAGFIASIICAQLFHKPLADLLMRQMDFRASIQNAVSKFLSGIVGNQMDESGVSSLVKGMSPEMEKIWNSAGEKGTEAINLLASQITQSFMYALSFVILIFFFRILFRLLQSTLVHINMIPLVGKLNQGLGMVLGGIQGVVIVMLLIFVANAFRQFSLPGAFMDGVEKSALAVHFVDFNFIFKIIDFIKIEVNQLVQ